MTRSLYSTSTGRSAKPSYPRRHTHDIGDNLAGHKLAVLVPVLAVLFPTCLIIPHLSVQEENDKESEVEVRDGGVEAGGEAPGQTTVA